MSLITQCVCARGKAIVVAVMDTKITQPEDVGI